MRPHWNIIQVSLRLLQCVFLQQQSIPVFRYRQLHVVDGYQGRISAQVSGRYEVDVNSRPAQEESKRKRRLLFVQDLYLARTLGTALAAVGVAASLYQLDAPLWAYFLLTITGFGWSHVAYFRASRDDMPVVREFENLRIDAALCGFWLPLTGFMGVPGVLMIATLGMQNAIVGGVRLLCQGAAGLLLGTALASALVGVHFHLFADRETRLACLPFLLIYPTVLGIRIGSFRYRDARDKARAHQQIAESRLANLLATSPTVLYEMEFDSRTWRCTEVTANIQRLLGYTLQEAQEANWWDSHVHPDDHRSAKAAVSRLTAGAKIVRRYRMMHKSGGYRWLRDELELQSRSDARVARIQGAWIDVTESEQAQADIHRLTHYDALTGLANRYFLQAGLTGILVQARQTEDLGGLLLIDIASFKAVNDSYGFSTGDQVLVKIGRRLRGGLRASDMLARTGGNSFAVVLTKLGPTQEKAVARARAIAVKLSAAISRPILFGNFSVCVTASVGIALFPNRDSTKEDVLREADIALDAAKETAKDRIWESAGSNISVFEPIMQDKLTASTRIQNEILGALTEGRFEFYLQRQVNSDGGIAGAEALIRLRATDGLLLFPNDFIPIAEESGLIVRVGQWLRCEACRLIARVDPVQLPRLSLNVSVIEFRQPRFVEHILNDCAQAGADPSRLTLEITESVLVDQFDDTVVKFNELRARGIRISIDDFGTRYSILAYLQRLPISEIKIDKLFIRDMVTDVRSARLTQSIITLAKNMEIEVVGEGVETQEQIDFLRLHGCEIMQGFFFGEPEPVANYLCWGKEFSEIRDFITKRC